MRRRLVLGAATLLMAGCNSDLPKLAEAKKKLDRVLLQKKTASGNLEGARKQREELDREVDQRIHVGLGPDAGATLLQSISEATEVVETSAEALEVRGRAPPPVVLEQLAALGQAQPGLLLSHLSFADGGFIVDLVAPPSPPPRPPSPPPAQPPPDLPSPGLWESAEAQQLRKEIAATYSQIGQLDPAIFEMTSDMQQVAHDLEILQKTTWADRLPIAADSAGVFFAGVPPHFTEGDLRFQGEMVVLTVPDPSGKLDAQSRPTGFHQRFTEPRVERAQGKVLFHMTRLPPARSPPTTGGPPRPLVRHPMAP